jgi:opacity protein-like surface antigen
LTVIPPLGHVAKLSKDDTKTGFVLGGGLEHAINSAWSIKAEYQYIDLGTDKRSADAGYPCDWATHRSKPITPTTRFALA